MGQGQYAEGAADVQQTIAEGPHAPTLAGAEWPARATSQSDMPLCGTGRRPPPVVRINKVPLSCQRHGESGPLHAATRTRIPPAARQGSACRG